MSAGNSAGMRFAIDAPTALRIIREDRKNELGRHPLVAPGGLRSHVLSILYSEVRRGEIAEKQGRSELDTLAGLKIRLLNDRVSRQVAWDLAVRLGWDDTPAAEYLAVASLQADALITADDRLSAAALGIVPLGSYLDLYR